MKKKNPTSFTVAFLRANLSDLVGKMVIPAGFESTACRLGAELDDVFCGIVLFGVVR